MKLMCMWWTSESLTTGDGQGWGVSESVTVITWYPIASDADCIGEFGWNGKEFDLTNWADGMEIEKGWIDKGYAIVIGAACGVVFYQVRHPRKKRPNPKDAK